MAAESIADGAEPADKASLIVDGSGDVPVAQVAQFLIDIEVAYRGLFVFQALVKDHPFLPPPNFDSPAKFRLLAQNSLMLKAVVLRSPGFWEFVGHLNPLETLRKYLSDRHERQKDRAFRSAHESRRLELENLLREDRVLAERIRLAREVGASEEQLAEVIDAFVARPLIQLSHHQDLGLIRGAVLRK